MAASTSLHASSSSAASSSSSAECNSSSSSAVRIQALNPQTLKRVSQQFEGKILSGPMLNFRGQRPAEHVWPVSVTVVTQAKSPYAAVPKVTSSHAPGLQLKPQSCLQAGERFFLRYELPIKQSDREQTIQYSVNDKSYQFHVPAIHQPAKWMFFSCNGYQTKADKKAVGGIQPLWQYFNNKLHKSEPFHLMVGGGDQIYCDGIVGDEVGGDDDYGKTGVFAVPSIKKWLAIPDDKDRLSRPFSEEMAREVTEFYLSHYCRHFSEPEFSDALAQVPSLMSWDDHDIFDGFGSHYPELNDSPVIQGIFQVALQFYLIFQQQASTAKTGPADLFGKNSYNFLRLIDDGEVAILGVDTRSERKPDQVVSPETWQEIFERLATLPANCKHLMVMFSVPMVYPSMRAFEKVLEYGDKNRLVGWFLEKLPGMKNQQLRQWELKDDTGDHWGSEAHLEERRQVIEKLQSFARTLDVRVSFLGGDVQVGGFGKIMRDPDTIPDAHDPHVMSQVISSGIGNKPPPKFVVTMLRGLGMKRERVNSETVMRLEPLTRKGNPSDKTSLVWNRNFATVQQDKTDGSLDVELHVERSPTGKHAGEDPKAYTVSIPRIHDPDSDSDSEIDDEPVDSTWCTIL